jgi:flavorubredoxin
MSPTIALGAGVDVLANPYAVDGRVSWHGRGVRGWATSNCLLLREDHRAVLIDTGLTVHRDAVLSALRELVDPGTTLELFVSRIGEFDVIGNLVDVIAAHDVRKVHAAFGDAPRWADMHPGHRLADVVPWAAEIVTEVLPREAIVELGPGRALEAVRPSLRNLSTYWVYDRASRTMFSGDSFCYGVAGSAAGPWFIEGPADDITVDDVRHHLLTGSRFWWLEGSRLGAIRAEVAALFARCPTDVIVPGCGRIIRGRAAVDRHIALLDAALDEIGAVTEAVA